MNESAGSPVETVAEAAKNAAVGAAKAAAQAATTLPTQEESGSDTWNWIYTNGGALLLSFVGITGLITYCYLRGRWQAEKSASIRARVAAARKLKQENDIRTKPVLNHLKLGELGRCQGLEWVKKTMKKDEDGDEAHGFLGPFEFTDAKPGEVRKTLSDKKKQAAAAAVAPATSGSGEKQKGEEPVARKQANKSSSKSKNKKKK
mmetsp:Transcript_10948/g.20818  ORF Transcript_10948/g.20818 Transcript_10948/m.20818 type:complete len:204 (+) Transcript_10948:40-651(+)|eukprot:CAMPEP_0175139018 /NCGR_PEP_ID=MMETSP0087-20121206/10666_1 /TAXON_ID=136419 /ORGANISM="Unknown Unknown, Strain D1" /LENGTH=203 /DNA_ID=CAMNT_0016421975 /DNA_START=39 /DNA_END=650 /DNA_ORIENTATION=-